jgi:hypothetical protein
MFNTVALILRPDEIRLFIVLMGALVSAVLAAVERSLRRILAQALERGRRGIPGPLARVLSRPISAELAAAMSAESGLAYAWIVAALRRLVCRWKERRSLRPPH